MLLCLLRYFSKAIEVHEFYYFPVASNKMPTPAKTHLIRVGEHLDGCNNTREQALRCIYRGWAHPKVITERARQPPLLSQRVNYPALLAGQVGQLYRICGARSIFSLVKEFDDQWEGVTIYPGCIRLLLCDG